MHITGSNVISYPKRDCRVRSTNLYGPQDPEFLLQLRKLVSPGTGTKSVLQRGNVTAIGGKESVGAGRALAWNMRALGASADWWS